MIKGVGVDIVAVARIQEALDRTEGFADRILTNSELERFKVVKQQAHFLAKRFAAKEALVKALGTGIGSGVTWHQIEIYNDEKGAPSIRLSGVAETIMQSMNAKQCRLSLSDEQHSAVAFVVID